MVYNEEKNITRLYTHYKACPRMTSIIAMVLKRVFVLIWQPIYLPSSSLHTFAYDDAALRIERSDVRIPLRLFLKSGFVVKLVRYLTYINGLLLAPRLSLHAIPTAVILIGGNFLTRVKTHIWLIHKDD